MKEEETGTFETACFAANSILGWKLLTESFNKQGKGEKALITSLSARTLSCRQVCDIQFVFGNTWHMMKT